MLLEKIIRTKLIPALTGRPPPNETERYLFALLARLGGIAMTNPTQATDIEFLSSTKITEALTEAILHQDSQYSEEVIACHLEAKCEVLTGASSNVQDGAHLDFTANGFWGGRFERTYFDV